MSKLNFIKLNIQRFAVQDDNTILKKADLKAYHEEIAPFLGGNFMMSTNVSDYYSTDEKIIGVWTNGKPIYQKVFPFNSIVILQDSTWYQTGFSGTGFENIVNAFGYRTQETGGSGPGFISLIAICQSSTREIYIMETRANVDTELSGFVLQYTKITDTATSALTTPGAYDINFPTTWPANKEIFFGNGVYGYRATGTITKGANLIIRTILINETFSSSAKIVSYGGYWSVTINNYVEKFSVSGARTDSYAYSSFLEMQANDISITSTVYVARNNDPYDIWVTYTK